MNRIRAYTTISTVALSLLVTACDRIGGDVADAAGASQLPPPAAALAGDGAVGVDARLERLDADLGRVLEGGLDEGSQAWLLAAEATTDRLLEEQLSADWLAAGYLVEARLRQVQALADRILAELRRGVARELVLEDVAALRLAVRDLRQQLAGQGNGAAPAPLDSLLAGSIDDRTGLGGVPAASSGTASDDAGDDGSAAAEEPVTAAPAGGPIGEPIRP